MRIVLADDHPLVRRGIRASLDGQDRVELVAEATDGDEALRAVLDHRPDLLLLDLNMPGMTSQEVITQARLTHPDLKVLILTAHNDDIHVGGLTQLFLSGYLLKDEDVGHLLQAIRVIDQGAVWFSQSVADRMRGLSRELDDPALLNLSERDREVLTRIGRGLDNAAVELSGANSAQLR